MNKIKKLVCMLLVVCFSVAAFPFTFASAASGQIAIQEASTGRYLTVNQSDVDNCTINALDFRNGEYWFKEREPKNEGDFILGLIGSSKNIKSFDNMFDSGLYVTDSGHYSDFKLKEAGDGTYYLMVDHESPTKDGWCYIKAFDDGDIDITADKDEAVKVNVYRK